MKVKLQDRRDTMKCNNRTTALVMCLAFVLAGAVFSGCGKSKGGGGEVTTTKTWYQDSDGDGFGNPDKTQAASDKPEGYVDNANDCNDTNSIINPGSVELNDGIDNDCDGEKDEKPKAGIIPDTAQTESYSSTFGVDADYIIDPPSYTKLDENGLALPDDAVSWKMVKDNVTGLIWEMKSSSDGVVNYKNIHDADNTYTWETATSDFLAKLNALDFGNFEDDYEWRLPTIKELEYLADCSRANIRISTKFFGNVSVNAVWSSTAQYDPNTQAWIMWPYYGTYDYKDKTEKYGIWAVRGKEMVSEFENVGSNMVRDKTTGLVWQKATGTNEDGEAMTFEDAVEYCENLELGGFTDWRLPSRNELLSIVKYDVKSPAIDHGFFSDTQSYGFWTSTTFLTPTSVVDKYNKGWKIDFSSGNTTYAEKNQALWVRAVRGGNNATLRKWHLDKDEDGYGDPAAFKLINSSVSGPAGYVLDSSDCDDADDDISPATLEIEDDGIDQNCTGKDAVTWYQDNDGDGYGNKNKVQVAEVKPASYVRNLEHIAANLFDCSDVNDSVNPGMDELADDGLDNDCNGLESVSWYVDNDNDGYGEGARIIASENPPNGGPYAANDLDCSDLNPDIHPGLVEILGNLTDTNCNGYIDDDAQHIIPDTGQLSLFTGTSGEDGGYTINPPSYTKIDADGNTVVGEGDWVAIRDNVTGLYWEVKTPTNYNSALNYSGAVDYAGSLILAGYGDWRLPTVTELATIADLEKYNPAINQTYFANMLPNRYWTATDFGSNTLALTVSFQHGATYPENKAGNYLVLAVRGGASLLERLVANGDGTVTDTETGLMWNDLETTTGNWDNSVTSWSGSDSAGYNDWRLPSESDMDTLLDILEQDSEFDFSEFFENVTFTGSFWTTTLAATDPQKAIVFSFITGEADEAGLLQILRGLGVRSVKQGRFVVNADGTVLDSKTGLMWMGENTNDGLEMTFESALNVCDTLTFADYSDWRMPSRNEMISLLEAFIEDREGFLAAFPDSEALYWTSSSCKGQTEFAWQVEFAEGDVEIISQGQYNTQNVFRAVRGGNIE